MSNLNAIETAIGQRLATPAILPIVYPNKAASPAKPYAVLQHVPTMRDSKAISGDGGVIERGYFTITVVAPSNTFSTVANGKADEIAARFPMGFKLAVNGRILTVTKPASPMTPYPDGSDWRQPIRVDYQVTDR
ncbi:MAG: phage tail terminator-like protein [Fuscovulum sp.]|nr:MAG: phage tail terminator-like protein [Fuscovulum sp.]